MSNNSTNLKTIIHTNYNKAQTRIVELAEKAQASLKDGSKVSRERLEETLAQWSSLDLLARLRGGGQELVLREELEALKATVAKLEEQLDALAAKGYARKSEVTKLTKRVNKLEKAPAKSGKSASKKAKKETPMKGAVNTDIAK